jgi:hypothetical protein
MEQTYDDKPSKIHLGTWRGYAGASVPGVILVDRAVTCVANSKLASTAIAGTSNGCEWNRFQNRWMGCSRRFDAIG